MTSPVAPRPILRAGPTTVELTDDPHDVAEIQRLRYRVFADEPGFADTIGDADTHLDADRFDEFCEHLVVRHVDDGIIGCARLLPPARAVAAGGWYTSTEFEVAELDGIRSATVEMGRAVVASAHRQGSTTALMWAALLQYLDEADCRYLVGCVSVPIDGPGPRGATLRGVRDELRDHHQAPWQVYPHARAMVDGRVLDDIEPPDKAPMPGLLRGYLRMGARVCGEPAVDDVFDVGDFVTVLDRERGNRRYLERLQAAVTRLAVDGHR
ncbi:GNAT family N-acetyltransferase [Gordonia insulae]|uniref:GNAT family N-acetyltransferase n=1 Tax=Gordonia insulae TaxID=2420509 RepID=UPI001E53A1DA|nr:GNAT family N-acyltransferase [Gordonia insulae]